MMPALVQELLSKKFLLAITVSFTLAACSKPTYTYYFNTYTPKQESVNGKIDPVSASVEISVEHLDAAQEEMLMVNDSNNPLVSTDTAMQAKAGIRTELTELSHQSRDEISEPLPEHQKVKASGRQNKKESDPSENKYAKRGFIFSLIGLIPFLFPLAIIGIITSAKGLKSEKRRLAVAGIIIGIVGLAFLVFVGVLSVAGAGG